MDGPRFARNVEATLQHAWERWCLEQITPISKLAV
jgi:hypothetical protein